MASRSLRSWCQVYAMMMIWFWNVSQWLTLFVSWWRHQMETFSALLAICAGNSPVPGEFPTQRPVTRSFDVYFDLRPNKRLSKQPWGWWFLTLSWSLWRHRNACDMILKCITVSDFICLYAFCLCECDVFWNPHPWNQWIISWYCDSLYGWCVSLCMVFLMCYASMCLDVINTSYFFLPWLYWCLFARGRTCSNRLGYHDSRTIPHLTNWGRVTPICVTKLHTIGSDNGLSPGRRQAIIWTNAGILFINPLETNFSEIFTEIYTLSFKKRHLKMSSGKWRLFCVGLNVVSQPDYRQCQSADWHS